MRRKISAGRERRGIKSPLTGLGNKRNRRGNRGTELKAEPEAKLKAGYYRLILLIKYL